MKNPPTVFGLPTGLPRKWRWAAMDLDGGNWVVFIKRPKIDLTFEIWGYGLTKNFFIIEKPKWGCKSWIDSLCRRRPHGGWDRVKEKP